MDTKISKALLQFGKSTKTYCQKTFGKNIPFGQMVTSFVLSEKQGQILSVNIFFHKAKFFICLTSQKLQTFGFYGTFYKLPRARYTPLVQPNPSCAGYSPPPARSEVSSTLYFSIILPVAAYTFSLSLIHRRAIPVASFW